MPPFLRNLFLDRFSFWVGFLTASLLWWLLPRLRPYLADIWTLIKQQAATLRQGAAANTLARYRAEVLRFAQHSHLAAGLFALDDIHIPLMVFAPPPTGQMGYVDIVHQVVPLLPDDPDVGTRYIYPQISLEAALRGGADVVLLGRQGSGKTVALAHLAAQMASRTGPPGAEMARLPVCLHAFDLLFAPAESGASARRLQSALTQTFPAAGRPRFSLLLDSALASGNCLMLLDGLDELTPAQAAALSEFLAALKSDHPRLQILAAASPLNFCGLLQLGFQPFTLAGLHPAGMQHLTQRWRAAWEKWIAPQFSEANPVDPDILHAWLSSEHDPHTPLEWTLKIWGSLQGDLTGRSTADALLAFVERQSVGVAKGRQALEKLAFQMLQNGRGYAQRSEVEAWLREFEAAPRPEAALAPDRPRPAQAQSITIPRVLPPLIEYGLLRASPDGGLAFCHPLVCAWLAAAPFSAEANPAVLLDQPRWETAARTLGIALASGGDSAALERWLAAPGEPLYTQLLEAGRWLRLAPESAGWRGRVLRGLAGLLNRETAALSLRLRAAAALACAPNSGAGAVFRQMLSASHPSPRRVGLLGIGLLQDPRLVEAVSPLLGDPVPSVRQAACLALVTIGAPASLEAVAAALLKGDDELRQFAAEALANDPDEGYPALQEGSQMDDVHVRRAVAYGLRRIPQSWAYQILEKLQVDDPQWVVKDAAEQAIKVWNREPGAAVEPPTPLVDSPWLIAFAAERGVGVSPGQAAGELLLQALKDGTPEQRQAAAEYLARQISPAAVLPLYHQLYASQDEVRETVFETLWYYGGTGVELPPPVQFGLGGF